MDPFMTFVAEMDPFMTFVLGKTCPVLTFPAVSDVCPTFGQAQRCRGLIRAAPIYFGVVFDNSKNAAKVVDRGRSIARAIAIQSGFAVRSISPADSAATSD
jgi:hypothetical protein